MPAAIGAALIGELALGATAELVVGYAVLSVGLMGLQYGAQALQGDQKRADHQVTVRQPVAPRRRPYGRVKYGGVIFALETRPYGESNRILVRGAVHCVGPVAIEQYWFGDVRTGLPEGAGGVVPDRVYQGKVVIEGHPGTDDQAASAALLTLPYWNEEMRLRGLAYTVVVATPLKHGTQIFPEGAPDVRVLVRGAACYDPRSGATAYTENAALVILDYLTHASGYGLALSEIDLASFAALADICDEPVPLVVPDPNGWTHEPRYRSWGSYGYDEARSAVLARLLAACDGELSQDGEGRVAIRGGRWQPPAFTITEGMILGWEQLEEGDEAYTAFTRIKHTFTSPFHDYQPVEGDPWDDLAAQAAQGVIDTERDFRQAPSHGQSRRLAKIGMHKGNPRFRLTGLRLAPAGLPAYGAPTVALALPSFGIDATFAVTRGALVLANNALTGVTLDLIALDAAAYAWDPAEEGQRPPLPDSWT